MPSLHEIEAFLLIPNKPILAPKIRTCPADLLTNLLYVCLHTLKVEFLKHIKCHTATPRGRHLQESIPRHYASQADALATNSSS